MIRKIRSFPFPSTTTGEESEGRDVNSTEPPTPHNLIVSDQEDEDKEVDYEKDDDDDDEEEDFSLDDIATDPEDEDEDDDDKPKEFPPEQDEEGEEQGIQASGKYFYRNLRNYFISNLCFKFFKFNFHDLLSHFLHSLLSP